MYDGLTPGCGGQGAYGPAAGAQSLGFCGAGCEDCEGDGGRGVSGDHIHLFIQYPLKYSVGFIAKRLKGRTGRVLRQEFPELKKWCERSLWAPSCYHGSVGHGWEIV